MGFLSDLKRRINFVDRKPLRKHRFDPSKRMIGIMMIRNENDILKETLTNITPIYDRIFVLDGTEPDDEFHVTRDILEQFEEVKVILRDADTPGPFPIRDGARQYLLQKVRENFGVNNWIGVLHGDELYTQDPRPILTNTNPSISPVLQVRLCHFFLHKDDQANWDHIQSLPVEARITHYMWPGTPEDRFFFDDGRVNYDPSRHSLVVPYGRSRRRILLDAFVIKQYNYRTPEQALQRAQQRISSAWQRNHYQHIAKEEAVFVHSLHVPGYEPCGHDNLKKKDQREWSKVRSTRHFPLPSLNNQKTSRRAFLTK